MTTIYFATDPVNIFTGFVLGIGMGLMVAYMFFSATLKLPVYYAFRFTSVLLILFAAGLLAHGIHELAEAGLIPEVFVMTSVWIPEKTTAVGSMLKSMFGITKHMDLVQLTVYVGYVSVMTWFVFIKPQRQHVQASS